MTQAVAAPTATEESCPAAEVLAGRMKPVECPHFGTGCTPDSPLGAPMVSSEGACAAYFRYHGASGGQPVPLDAATQEDT